MIYKEKLAGGGGNNQVKDYTHIVTVASFFHTRSFWYGYDQYYNSGSMIREYSPVNDELSNYNITGLYQEENTISVYCDTNFSDQNKKIYLGRKDKNIITTEYKNQYGLEFGLDFFTEDDVDQDVEIWLATTPPPWWEDPNGHAGDGAQIG